MTTPTDVPKNIQESKAEANALYAKRDYAGALSIYESILLDLPLRNASNAVLAFVRTILSNRAACFMELGRYEDAVTELNKLLNIKTPAPDASIVQKTHFRLAKCYHRLKNPTAALSALSEYQKCHGRPLAQETPDEESLHYAILDSLQPQGSRAVIYNLYVSGNSRDSTMHRIRYYDSVPANLCTRLTDPASRAEGTKFLQSLVDKYDTKMTVELVKANRMFCWNCDKPARSNVHSPGSWLFDNPPGIQDWVQPVCSRGGVCESEAYKFMAEVMKQMNTPHA